MTKFLTVKDLILQLSTLPDDAIVTNEAGDALFVHNVADGQVFITDVDPSEDEDDDYDQRCFPTHLI
jgi:hypothetical protein